FDAWSEHFRPRLWEEAFDEAGIDVGASTGEIPLAAVLPWDHIDIGVSKDYLLGELAKAKAAEVTRDCTFADCSRCGVCGAFAVKPLKRGGKAPCD
ncbi:MAG TPA: B12-binding domain-containing radical SAM protein, partial [Bacillota bacterium]|nr:B12-binding domain-containing radical SAM protein [Bacillota bacterium]